MTTNISKMTVEDAASRSPSRRRTTSRHRRLPIRKTRPRVSMLPASSQSRNSPWPKSEQCQVVGARIEDGDIRSQARTTTIGRGATPVVEEAPYAAGGESYRSGRRAHGAPRWARLEDRAKGKRRQEVARRWPDTRTSKDPERGADLGCWDRSRMDVGEPKLLWRSEKLHISYGAVPSSAKEVIHHIFLWWLL